MSSDEEESFEDFSASEDEWQPPKYKKESDSDFEDTSVNTTADYSAINTRTRGKLKQPTMKAPIKKVLSNSLRNKLFSKHNLSIKKNNSKITQNSIVKKNVSQGLSDDSESSGDDYLVDPNKVDLSSKFFQNIEKLDNKSPPPLFDCNIGNLTDSDSGDDDGSKEATSPMVNLNNLNDFDSKIEHAKQSLEKYTKQKDSQIKDKPLDVTSLLAMGESTKTASEERSKFFKPNRNKTAKRKIHENSESDWEDVDEIEIKPKTSSTNENIQVIVELPTEQRKKRNRDLEFEIELKRKINRVKKENQLCLHKTNILCWIGHMNHVNTVLNSTILLADAMKLIPSKNCYPKDKTDVDYFEQISKWYKTLIVLKNDSVYPIIKSRPKLEISLGLQIKTKMAICKRDFIFIFVILARAIGCQCRIVMNLVTAPIRPPLSELCPINRKKEENSIKVEKSPKEKPSNKQETKISVSVKKLTPVKPIIEKELTVKKTTVRRSASPKSTKSVPETNKSSLRQKLDKNSKNTSKPKTVVNKESVRKSLRRKLNDIPQLDGGDDFVEKKTVQTRSLKAKLKMHSTDTTSEKPKELDTKKTKTKESTEILKSNQKHNANNKRKSEPTKSKYESDEDFKPTSSKRASTGSKKNPAIDQVKKIDRRVLSTDDESNESKNKKLGCDYWVEMYSEKSKQWFAVDLLKSKVDNVEEICRQATHPISYVFAWNNDNTIKDVSARYCNQWNTVTRKQRVPQKWLDEAIKSCIGKKTVRDKKEDIELNKIHMDKPLPTTVSEFKNHPLYALGRHLLKFEAIYPPDALTLGFIRNEPVYARECVHTLHSRELWLKQARVVKPGQQPYKIVTARPKWDRFTNTVIKGQPLEIFGIWQTDEYDPPTAENGIVPRNAYGNVELFKESMLPKKTVLLRFNGLNRVCKKLRIDCAPAVTGFDYHQGACHPVYDGFVVCEEFQEIVTNAWLEFQEEQNKKDQEKYEKRVYGNWRKLIRGLLIREKLKIKYNYEELIVEHINENEATEKKKRKK